MCVDVYREAVSLCVRHGRVAHWLALGAASSRWLGGADPGRGALWDGEVSGGSDAQRPGRG